MIYADPPNTRGAITALSVAIGDSVVSVLDRPYDETWRSPRMLDREFDPFLAFEWSGCFEENGSPASARGLLSTSVK